MQGEAEPDQVVKVFCTKYVLFSVAEAPHDREKVQHTPKPDAQAPEVEPPLAAHSSLV